MKDSTKCKYNFRTKSLMSKRIESLIEVFSKLEYQRNGISMSEIGNELRNNYELEPTRNTIYRDIDFINDNFDYEVKYNEKVRRYKITKKAVFNIEDIEIITNAITSSKFYSVNMTRELVNKLYDNMGYKRISTIDLDKMSKAEDDDLVNKVKLLDEAIKANKKVNFNYYKLDSSMKDILSIPDCVVSPIAHIWYEDLYYLLGNFQGNRISHYRIDRIRDIRILKDKRIPICEISKKQDSFNIGEYISKLAGMSSGNEETIDLKVKTIYLGRIKDKFGKNYNIISRGNDWCRLRLKIIYNKDLIFWILSLGEGIEILSPNFLREEVYNYINNMKKIYEN